MDLITLDWETYYNTSTKYSLSHMSTEEYVTDEQFEIIGVGIKINDAPAEWYSLPRMSQYGELLHDIGYARNAALAHNSAFDFLIPHVYWGLTPKVILDTLSMAQAWDKPFHRSISLDNCLKRRPWLGVKKLDYVHHMNGMRRSMITPQQLSSYGEYCKADTDGCYALFQDFMKDGFPRDELHIIDMSLRMYLEPQLLADEDTFKQVWENEIQRKEDLMRRLPGNLTKTQIRSNPQFAELLRRCGVEPPIKISLTTGKPTYAFAKTDPGWIELKDTYADNGLVMALMEAREGVKSSIAETRAERLYNIARRYGWLRVPLRYYAAHTGRYGGREKINAQNFTRVDKKAGRSQLRYGIKAPKGKVIIAPDLSQIEARLNAWNAGCKKLVQVFEEDGDPYSEFAQILFRKPVRKGVEDTERFIGKTCILGLGYGMGAPKLVAQLLSSGMPTPLSKAQGYVSTYRQVYNEIPELWRKCDEVIQVLAGGGRMQVGKACMAERGGITLPNGMRLEYADLKHVSGKEYTGWSYAFAGQGRTLWGGKVVENITQALARIVIMENMLAIKKELGLRPAMQAHDEIVYVVDEDAVEETNEAILEIMARRPWWAPGCPIKGEIEAYGKTYGDCK